MIIKYVWNFDNFSGLSKSCFQIFTKNLIARSFNPHKQYDTTQHNVFMYCSNVITTNIDDVLFFLRCVNNSIHYYHTIRSLPTSKFYLSHIHPCYDCFSIKFYPFHLSVALWAQMTYLGKCFRTRGQSLEVSRLLLDTSLQMFPPDLSQYKCTQRRDSAPNASHETNTQCDEQKVW